MNTTHSNPALDTMPRREPGRRCLSPPNHTHESCIIDAHVRAYVPLLQNLRWYQYASNGMRQSNARRPTDEQHELDTHKRTTFITPIGVIKSAHTHTHTHAGGWLVYC